MLNTTDLHQQHVETELETIEARLGRLEDAIMQMQGAIQRLSAQRETQPPDRDSGSQRRVPAA
jgi:hypothetical protein